MRTFKPFVIGTACYAALVAVYWTGMVRFLGSYGPVLLGLGLFALTALGAWSVRKRGVWPKTMLVAVLTLAAFSPIWTGCPDIENIVFKTGPILYRFLLSVVVVIIGVVGVIMLAFQVAEARKAAGAVGHTRRGLLPILVLILLVVSAVACGVSAGVGAAPTYEGKRAGTWIELLGQSFVPNEIFGRSDRKKPEEALRSIGPPAKAAVPALVEALKDTDPKVREWVVPALQAVDPETALKAVTAP